MKPSPTPLRPPFCSRKDTLGSALRRVQLQDAAAEICLWSLGSEDLSQLASAVWLRFLAPHTLQVFCNTLSEIKKKKKVHNGRLRGHVCMCMHGCRPADKCLRQESSLS